MTGTTTAVCVCVRVYRCELPVSPYSPGPETLRWSRTARLPSASLPVLTLPGTGLLLSAVSGSQTPQRPVSARSPRGPKVRWVRTRSDVTARVSTKEIDEARYFQGINDLVLISD